ncbi:cytochrome P450 71D11-like [Morus notabilis]|uniref:cytochrome P450 71D11-like n=1 Tax=Morus notabilis TaxID=981085 RepID=UPI000CED06D3|nr:cytochrome P450 71D11-like [Morus notabilis]
MTRIANSTLNLPPGPWRLPVIGNLNLLIDSLPHRRLRELAKEYGPLMHQQLGALSNVVSSPEIMREIMKRHDVNFSQRQFLVAASICGSVDIAFAPYGDYKWRGVGLICEQELMSPGRVQSFKAIREEEVSSLLGYLYSSAGSPINLREKIFSFTYAITAKAAFGKRCEDQEAFVSSVEEGIEFAGGFSVSEVFPSQKWLHWISGVGPKLEKIFNKTDEILERIVEEC